MERRSYLVFRNYSSNPVTVISCSTSFEEIEPVKKQLMAQDL